MQRLQCEADTGGAGVGQDRRDAVLHHAVRGGEVARTLGQAASDQNEDRRADFGGHVNGAA